MLPFLAIFSSFIIHMLFAMWPKSRWSSRTRNCTYLQIEQKRVSRKAKEISMWKNLNQSFFFGNHSFFSPWRYEKVAREWTLRYAMWRQWRIPGHLKNAHPHWLWLRCFILLGHFLSLDFTWLNCFYCLLLFFP